ncbi:MAG TPA: hypothetical protein VJ527_14625 [Rhodanobacter sp.]|nr:hypothetical protein [Rhodanobacter sp.]
MTTPLPPTDPTAPDAQLPGEAELAALYRQLPRSEPDPALDAAVLHAAAQALAAGEHPLTVERRRGPRERGDWVRPKDQPLPNLDEVGVAPRRRTPPWLLGLGSAASLVLVAGLAWHLYRQPASVPATPASDAADTVAAPAADRPATAAAGVAAAKAAPPAETAPAAAPMAFHAAVEAQGVDPAQERELAAIRQLFAEHHDEEAQQRLEDFRRQHPQRELPEDLRLRLRQP